MARGSNQKWKLLALLDILSSQTDEQHPLGVPQLVELLAARGIPAERKSLYDDMDALRNLGYDIQLQRGHGGGYFLEGTTFELPELKLLVDAVQASKFITRRKSQRLIEKLETFTSRYHAEELKRQVLVSGRFKAQDERIYYSVDALHRAITAKNQIRFQYRDWTVEKKLQPRHGGKVYQVSPWALVWESGNYYLIATVEGQLRHYRVDKISQVDILETPCTGEEAFHGFDVTQYVQQMFEMYGGPRRDVTLRCEDALAGAIIDRFGTGPTLLPQGDGHFTIHVTIQASPTFYGWLCSFGGRVQLAAPSDLRAEFAAYLRKLSDAYSD